MKKLLLLSLLLAVSGLQADPAGADLAPTRDTASTEPVLIYEEDPTLMVTTIDISFLSGAANDPQGKTGLASLFTDLMLRGTKKRTRTVFQSELERMGASLDVRTTHDTISFVGEVIKENTIPFLKLVEDCILHPRFGTTDFNELKTETIADIANWKNSNNRLSGLALRKVLFAGTPLEHPSDGSLSTVAAITLKDVTSEYKKVITQGNLVFGVASPLKQADVQAVLWPIWKGLPKSERVKRTSIAPKLPTTPQLVVINKPKTSTGALVFGQAGITVHDPYRYTLGVANYAFGSEPLISRLFRIVRSELGYTYSIGSSYGTMGALSDQEGIFTISATPSVEFTTKTMLKVLDLWHDYLKTGLGGGELNLAHESMVNSYPFEFDSADKRLGEKLYSYIYGVPVLSPAEYKKTIDAVDRAQIQHALASRQTGDGWVITLVADADEIRKQLDEQQKDTPKEKRLTISKTFTPDEIIE